MSISRSTRLDTLWLAIACGLFCVSNLPGQERAALVATSLAEVDADFYIQGEYLGSVRSAPYGLQVAALGGGSFVARCYRGGLPGSGWDRSEPVVLDGTRNGDAPLELNGPRSKIVVAGGTATVVDEENRPVGRLSRVKRYSPTLGRAPTTDAIALFDIDGPHYLDPANLTADELLLAGTISTLTVQDFRLHVEFRLPYMPFARDQGRANSGVYIQKRYEVQILDSFGLDPVFNGCGSLYRQQPPDLNMSFPPLSWQTYDIYFIAARFDQDGNKTAHARISVLHNGIAIHADREVTTKTGAGDREGRRPGPLRFQDHRNPVVFRNLWVERFESELPTMKLFGR